ncbi:methylated-DNA--[protein]-cysteine S-methyltransferase [Curvibacter delicatus]|jgi:AraC family transcriptional regulator of adaptative response/methylated-DNA-[protein]-cysteine methyltransferase|uniref:methylated-DNA--[protein]-cysteine S-methyltransferase n=1 Tax=Curvibacter delicatus TaxID=80879 RepID=UPI000832B225|nr:methylated-DNA--[protein]-cysteine S-methyltransferase [Curvibacter delicatus]
MNNPDPARHYVVVARAIDYLRCHALRQPTLAEVAAAVHMSEFHLQRVFAAWVGISPKRFLQYLTKEHARQALRMSADLLSVTEASGLSSPGRLHDLLVSCEAMTPGEIKQGGAGVRLGFGFGATPFGEALVGWTARGLCYLAFLDEDDAVRQDELASQWPAAQRERDDVQAQQWLDRVFLVTPQRGTLHLVLRGTNFQIKVWEALLKVEPSRVVSYTQLAQMAGAHQAQRAVGSALAANTIAYLIPCHRVIRESGDFGHYRWGSGRKMALLAWEAGQAEHEARPE